MMNLLAKLKRRQMFRVAAAYAVVAWVLLQVVNNVAPALMLPNWAATLVLVLLVVGFPVALLFCWIHELGPAGGDSKATTGKLDWVLIGALIAVLGLVSYQQLAPNGATTVERQAGVAAARSASLSPAGVSVAVLPFANVSADPEQEFFSDGITDEISGALAKIPDLRVVARTSAFQYKTRNTDIRSIGQALNATHLIEGSVRSAGGRIRIGVQLILADTGLQLWSENYDRELTDIFAIQEDIARAIASSLNMQLGLRPGENLVSNRTVDVDLYQQFLRVRAQVRALNTQRIREEALPQIEKLVARDPSFAPAWGYLSLLYLTINIPLVSEIWTRPVEETRRLWQPAYEKSEKAAREAIRLDPRQAFAYTNLAWLEVNRKRWAAAEDLYRKALELDPNDPDVLASYGRFLLHIGRVKESIRIRQQAVALEPLVPLYATDLADSLMADGQGDAAVKVIETTPPRQAFGREILAKAYAMAGRFDDAAAQILRTNNRNMFAPEAARLIRSAPAKAGDPSALPAWPGRLDFVYGYVGAPERLLDYPERAMEADELYFAVVFDSQYAPVRKTERFKTFVRNAGLVDYWKARGWPDLCKPVGANDFVCD
jgi:TolB-like protein/Tfp pilus assembly protein PilF